MPVAYAPRAGVAAEELGTVAVGDRTLNLAEALQEGDGVIVVPDDDLETQVRLNEIDALKNVAVPHPKDEPGAKPARSADKHKE